LQTKKMKLVIAIIRPAKVSEVKDVLFEEKVERFVVTDVMGCGSQKGYTESYKNTTVEVNLIKKAKLEIEVADKKVRSVVQKIIAVCRSGRFGDGKIFVVNIPKYIEL
jgi:nitrogen regulatory protein PII